MPYIPRNIPSDPAELPGFLLVELENVSRATRYPFLQLDEMYAAPARPTAGMVALADGTKWNPGSGAGFYGYYGGSWKKLG